MNATPIRNWMLCAAATLLVSAAFAYPNAPSDIQYGLTAVVGRVGAVYAAPQDVESLHRHASKRHSDTPALDVFREQEQWVAIYSSESSRHPGVFMGRAPKSLNLKEGDTVRMRLTPWHKVRSYEQHNTVEELLCRAGEADVKNCAQQHPLGWFTAEGRFVPGL